MEYTTAEINQFIRIKYLLGFRDKIDTMFKKNGLEPTFFWDYSSTVQFVYSKQKHTLTFKMPVLLAIRFLQMLATVEDTVLVRQVLSLRDLCEKALITYDLQANLIHTIKNAMETIFLESRDHLLEDLFAIP
jgi:hypothetical protein